MRAYGILAALLLLPVGFSGAETAGKAANCRSFRVAPSYFIPNAAPAESGQRLVDDTAVVAFVQTARGRVLFTPAGAYVGIAVPDDPDRTPAGRPPMAGPGGELVQPPARVAVLQAGFTRPHGPGQGNAPLPRLEEETRAKVNFFCGEAEDWRTNVPVYRKLAYPEVWPGVDVEYLGYMDRLELQVVIHPGADPSPVRLETGADRLVIDPAGSLRAERGGACLSFSPPRAYQEIGGRQVDVAVSFKTLPGGGVGFDLGRFDPRYGLVIDPVLRWSTFLGGDDHPVDFLFPTDISGEDGKSVAVDGQGGVYVTGWTQTLDFPVTSGAVDSTANGAEDAFVAKINSADGTLVYATYLGGSGQDHGWGIAVDGSGNAYLTGETTSLDFPTTPEAWSPRNYSNNWDAFIVKLNAAGDSLIYSTYLSVAAYPRVENIARSIAVDGGGNATITGSTRSDAFPVTAGAFDTSYNGGWDAFVTKFNSTGSALVYSTYLGGTLDDQGYDLAVDGEGTVYLTGDTQSWDFPVSSGAFDTSYNGYSDVFVVRLNSAGSALGYSTFLGSSVRADDEARGIAVDGSGNAYVTGRTAGSTFPVTSGVVGGTSHAGDDDLFVTKLNSAGSALVYSTYLGGTRHDGAGDIAVDPGGNAYVAGATNSNDFPATAGAAGPVYKGLYDAFAVKLNSTATALLYSTILGGANFDSGAGIAIDGNGIAYVAGTSNSADFIAAGGAASPILRGPVDVFVSAVAPDGKSLVFSSFLGGSGWDIGDVVTVDSTGGVYLAGTTSHQLFPTTSGVFDNSYNGSEDVFVAKFDGASGNLVYSTYLGGRWFDRGYGIAADGSGNAYVTGLTRSDNFPVTAGALDTTINGQNDAFVVKLNSTGSGLLYSTFLGGSGSDEGSDIVLDGGGNAYVSGTTTSTNFPVTPGAPDQSCSLKDAFAAKLNSTGSALVYATYLGGGQDDQGSAIAVDGAGCAYLTGWTESADFPTTPGALDTSLSLKDAFVAKVNSAGNGLVYSTFLGGGDIDQGNGIDVDGAGNAVVTGGTASSDFPTTSGALYTAYIGRGDAFVSKLNGAGSSLLLSTYIGGGDYDTGYSLVLDPDGAICLTGNARSYDFPVTAGAPDTTYNGGLRGDAFVSKLYGSTGGLAFSTFLGGSGDEVGSDIAVDGQGVVYVTGTTMSGNFPISSGAYDSHNAGSDVFLTSLDLSQVIPDTPSGLQATVVSTSRISLAWTDNSGNEDGFQVERKADPGGAFGQIAAVGSNVTAFMDTGLPSCTGFTYRVRATNGLGGSAWSNEASAITLGCQPAAPANLTATAVAPTRIDLAWTDPAVDEAGFEIERKTGTGGSWGAIATVAADVVTYADTAAATATTYVYRVRAYNAWGDSPWSNDAAATTPAGPPAAPSALSATAVATDQIHLAWNDNSPDETAFRIERADGAGKAWAVLATTGPTERHFRDFPLAADATYTYRVCALAGATASAWSNEASAATSSTRPAAPSNLAAYGAGGSWIDLAWQDHAGNEMGFAIERKVSLQGSWTALATVGANTTAFADTSPVAGSVCLYRVRAENAAGASAWSNQAGASTAEYDCYIPAAAHTAGLNDTFWQTDLDLLNPYPDPVEAEVALLRANTGNATPAVITRSVPGLATVRLVDVLGTAFTAANAALGVRCPNGWVLPNSRFYNTASPCGGTYGMYVAGVDDGKALWGDGGATRGWFHLVGYSPDPAAGFRTNVGFVNASAFNVQVLMRLYGDGGELLGWLSHVLLPYEHRQFTRLHESLGTPAVSHGTITVEVLTEGGKVHAYAMLIDNLSGDPIYMPVKVIPW